MQKVQKKNCCPRCFLGTLIYIFVLLILLFIVVFAIVPVIFKYSPGIQRSIIFPTWVTPYENFSDIESFDITGVQNFYIDVSGKENVTLGAWHIIPSDILSEFINNDDYNYEEILKDPKYNILLYLHGNGGVRSIPLEIYSILRKDFQIIAIDYRGYGDSTKAQLYENGIVNDLMEAYKWLRSRTKARIFIWGHSVGTGVGTHLVYNLKAENYTPTGLILEAPFSSVIDVMERHIILKMYSWLPWYRTTFIDPIIENGMGFNSTHYIKEVDCPILILHAKDDDIIPYDLATKLYETAITGRNLKTQGNVTYHLFEAKGYRHMELYLAPELPTVTRNFVSSCIQFEEQQFNET